MRVVRFARGCDLGRAVVLGAALLLGSFGCHQQMMRQTDRDVAKVIRARQQGVLGGQTPAGLDDDEELPRPGRSAYEYAPNPSVTEIPEGFRQATSQPASSPSEPLPSTRAALPTATTLPVAATQPADLFTLTDALAYAQRHRREYQTAKEDLYLSALALTLERHLWTPIFASELKTVYGNYGEAENFDQAMRFVADLSVAQRLPYGGEFTAKAISTLIRDVGKTITAAEGGDIALGLDLPLLRGAGHVARETLIQLERELTYSVRVFERFRRQQLVTVADGYFGVLLAKQNVVNQETRYENSIMDYRRAKALEETGTRSVLDTLRAEQAMLGAENNLEAVRESFRLQADNFKLLIGMPVDEPLGMERLEDIESIERGIEAGEYPLLECPRAIEDEEYALEVALKRRLDLLTTTDRIDDARRGVAISRNALLPDLDWNSSLTFDTDPEHFNSGAHEFERANWRSELVLALPLERTAERNKLRRAIVDVRAAQRGWQDRAERIRVEVRRAVNRIRLEEKSLEIQGRNVYVAERRQEYAEYRFSEVGDIDNRDKVEAETELLNARNSLNAAKTSRWTSILQFRLATETLNVDENGVQHPAPDVPVGP